MPLSFILSGYVQHEISGTKRGYINGKIRRIVYPYFAFTVLGAIPWGIYLYIKGNTIFDIILNFFYIKGMTVNNPLWFLIVLFEIYIICAVTDIVDKNMRFQTIISILAFTIGGNLYKLKGIDSENCFILRYQNLFGVNRAIVCFGFFVVGMLLKESIEIEKVDNLKIKRILLLIFLLILNLLFGVSFNKKISIFAFDFGNYISFLIAAISGSLAVILGCKMWFDKEGYFARLSKYSIFLLGIQFFIILPFRKTMEVYGLTKTWLYDIWMFTVIIIMIYVIPLLYEWMVRKIPIIRYFNGEVR